jgi:predicted small secreted protein
MSRNTRTTRTTRTTSRIRPDHRGRATRAAIVLVALGAVVLTGCSTDSGGGAAAAGGSSTDGTVPPSGSPSAAHSAPAEPGATTAGGSTGRPSAAAPTATATHALPHAATGTPTATAVPLPSTSCGSKQPISPDEIAVYRYTPEGGSLSLIVKYGNWGCPEPDSDGAPFETVGKQTYLPLDQAAHITATNPIVESTSNQMIGVQELLDWLEAHPDSGLVFKYHLGADGAIDQLDEVFTP